MYSVYTLSDPRTDEVRYVGMSNDAERRYTQHMSQPYEKQAWMRELSQIDEKPKLAIIESDLSLEVVRRREQYWIGHYLKSGASLFNYIRRDIEITDDKKIFTPAEAAEYLSRKAGREITVSRLSQLRKEKRVKATKFGRTMMLYVREDLDAADTSYHFRTR